MTKFLKFKLAHVLLFVLAVALVLACFVEKEAIIGQSSTSSPDGNWILNLKLTEFSTLVSSRKRFDTNLKHSTNSDWDVSTSVPFNDADAIIISNQNPSHPVVWSDDSSTVSFWINHNVDDWIKIEAESRQFKFQRKLNSVTVTETSASNGG